MPKEKIPDGAIFQPQPKDAKGAPATKKQMKMIEDSYYQRGSVGRDSMFDSLKAKYPDTHPPRRAIQRFLNRQSLQQRLSIPTTSTLGCTVPALRCKGRALDWSLPFYF